MDIETAGLVGFVFAATSLAALLLEREMGAMSGYLILGPLQQRTSICSMSNLVLFLNNLMAPVSKRLGISIVVCAIALAGCARNRPQHDSDFVRPEAGAGVVRATSFAERFPEQTTQPRIHRVSRALLAPQPVPDCEFKGSDQKTVDRDQWSRVKLEYEWQCYKNAEVAARKRVRLLQAFIRSEIATVEH
jgi:hypothetical protein